MEWELQAKDDRTVTIVPDFLVASPVLMDTYKIILKLALDHIATKLDKIAST